MIMETFKLNDGGREAAGYKGKTGDCVARSIAIVCVDDEIELLLPIKTKPSEFDTYQDIQTKYNFLKEVKQELIKMK